MKTKANQPEEIKTEEVKTECCINSKHRGGFGAVLLITIGSLLLLNNFGVLPWNIWGTLWRFWPLILIFGGLEAIFGKTWLSSIIITILGLFILAVIVSVTVARYNSGFDNWIQKKVPSFNQIKRNIPLPKNLNNLDIEQSFHGCKIKGDNIECW